MFDGFIILTDDVSAPSLVRACKCFLLSWSCEVALFLVPPACLLKVGISMIWVPGLRDGAGDREKMLWFRICILMALTQQQEVGGKRKDRNSFQGHTTCCGHVKEGCFNLKHKGMLCYSNHLICSEGKSQLKWVNKRWMPSPLLRWLDWFIHSLQWMKTEEWFICAGISL